jgi:hypothetical protein
LIYLCRIESFATSQKTDFLSVTPLGERLIANIQES